MPGDDRISFTTTEEYLQTIVYYRYFVVKVNGDVSNSEQYGRSMFKNEGGEITNEDKRTLKDNGKEYENDEIVHNENKRNREYGSRHLSGNVTVLVAFILLFTALLTAFPAIDTDTEKNEDDEWYDHHFLGADKTVEWRRIFGGLSDRFEAVAATSDGFVAVGRSSIALHDCGDWSAVERKGVNDAIIVRFDSDGNVMWKKSFGNNGFNNFNEVVTTSDGFVAVGYSQVELSGNDWSDSEGRGLYDAIMVKFDPDGNVMWKNYVGGEGFDYFNGVAATSDGFVAVGYSEHSSFGTGDWSDFDGKGNADATIVKFDTEGNVIWKKNFGDNHNDYFTGVLTEPDGFVAVGYSAMPSLATGDWSDVNRRGLTDAIIVKFDLDGNVVWKNNFGGASTDFFYGAATTSDGFVAVGYSSGPSFATGDWSGVYGKGLTDAIIVKFDLDGNVVWKNNFGGSDRDYYHEVTATSDGFVAVGYSYGQSFATGDWEGVAGNGLIDSVIVKYDDNGNIIWKKNFGGNDIDQYLGVTTLADGNAVAVGQSNNDSFGTGDWIGINGIGINNATIVKHSRSMCTVSFNPNDDLAYMTSPIKVEEGLFPRTAVKPSGTWSKTGYTNDGEWYTRTDDNEYKLFTFGSTRVYEDIILHLKWEIICYGVVLTSGNGYTLTALSPVSLEYGESFTFEFNLDWEYSNSRFTVFVNDKPIDIADGGRYTIENVTRSVTVTVSGVIFNAKPFHNIKLARENGYVLTALSPVSVEHGESFTFEFNLDKKYSGSLFAVFVNGKLIDIADGGRYTIENVTRSVTVTVSGVMPDTRSSEERRESKMSVIMPCLPAAAGLSVAILKRRK